MTQRQQEIIILAGLYIEGLRWLGRDGFKDESEGSLCGYREKPHKESYIDHKERSVIYWNEPQNRNRFFTEFDGLLDYAFPEIIAEDEEPTNIGELLSKKILEELRGCGAKGEHIQNIFDR